MWLLNAKKDGVDHSEIIRIVFSDYYGESYEVFEKKCSKFISPKIKVYVLTHTKNWENNIILVDWLLEKIDVDDRWSCGYWFVGH